MHKIESSNVIEENMMVYGLSIILSRALPLLEDGFKPSQRKSLYTMYKMGLFNQKAKSANVDGQIMKINPHGSNYSTIVRMTNMAEVLLTPYIEGKGAFGKVYSESMEPAASRYTEIKLMPVCHEFFDNIKKVPGNMVPNYDSTTTEPALLSAPFPNILVNAQSGVALGFACFFPSFNLREVCDAAISVLKGKDKFKDIYKVMPGADFSTGALALDDKEAMEKIYTEGTGPITLRAVIEDRGGMLEVTSIPYTTTAEKISKEVLDAFAAGKLPEITDVRDEIDMNGFKLTVDYKRGTDVEDLKNKLYYLTSLQDKVHCNLTLVVDNRPETLGVIDIIKRWVEHRREWVRKEVEFDLSEKSTQLQLLQGLAKILLDIDKAVEIVKSSKNDEEVISKLQSEFEIGENEAEYVANIKLRNFNRAYIEKKTDEIKNLENDIKTLEEVLESGIDERILSDLKRVKKEYGIDRKTVITKFEEVVPVVKAPSKKLDGNSTVFISPTEIKRVSDKTTAKTPAGFTRYEVENSSEILVFTSHANAYKIKMVKVPIGKTVSIDSLIKLETGETCLYSVPMLERDMILVFDNMKLARFPMSVYEGNRKKFKKAFNSKNNVIYITSIDEDTTFELNGKTIDTSKFKQKQGRATLGVKI